MHEMSLVQALLETVDAYARKDPFQKVNSLSLSFGRMSGVDPQALAFAFSILSKDTRAEGARLDFDIRPAMIYCFSCRQDIPLALSYEAACPRCGGAEVIPSGGTEGLLLVEMDVD